jgi:hypothetical protein
MGRRRGLKLCGSEKLRSTAKFCGLAEEVRPAANAASQVFAHRQRLPEWMREPERKAA